MLSADHAPASAGAFIVAGTMFLVSEQRQKWVWVLTDFQVEWC